jgi:hypothetical protein
MLQEAFGSAQRIGFGRIAAGSESAYSIRVVVLQCSEPESLLAVEEVIEAAFAEPRFAYDLVHARRGIAVAEHQLLGGADELLASVHATARMHRRPRSRRA